MPPQRSQSPRGHVARPPHTWRPRYGLVRPDARWTGPSAYSLSPNAHRYFRPANAENASRSSSDTLRSLYQASDGSFGARYGISSGSDASSYPPISTPSANPLTIPRIAPAVPLQTRSGPLPATTSAPIHSVFTGISPTQHHCHCSAIIQNLRREQAEARAELRQMRGDILSLTRSVDTAREEIDDIREDVRPRPAPTPSIHGTGARGTTTPAASMIMDPATVEAEFEDLMKQSVRELALASSLFLRISRVYISRAVNPPRDAMVLTDTVDAYTEFWRAVHFLARTSQADRERLYALTGSPAHLDEPDETVTKSEDDMDV